jgi:hypothetical protein
MRRIGWIIAALWAPAALASYKCVDEKGLTRIGDTPPPECANVIMYEMKGTAVVRKIEPSLTLEQIKAKAQEAERNKAVLRAEGDKKRADMALLNTYSTEKEFDVARDRNIEPIMGRISSATDRIKQVEARQKKLEDEMEFYKSGKSAKSKGGETPPQALVDDIKRAQAEKAALVNATVGYEKEIEEVKAKYEADKKRWIELRAEQQGTAADEEKADAKADAKAGAKPAATKGAPKKS